MLLRKADLGPGYLVERTSGLDPHLTCAALDESDLTVTGEAETPDWARDLRIASSASAVYESVADANASWKRGTRATGLRCLREEFRRELARQGEEARVSVGRVAFPRVSQRAAAYRVTISGKAQGQSVVITIDFVILMHGRAQAALLFASVLLPPERQNQIALARLVAGRMAKAMRGA
jgi:hypothetical protein